LPAAICGSLTQELSYDPWGRLRNPATQVAYTPDSDPTLFLGRGYTGHEHLTVFGLINMNARLYDAALGRFLSPDPYVQAPDFSQNFNRYSYCLNNPLRYSDPNGEFIFSLFLGPVGAVLDAACWGAVIGGAGYTASVAFSNGGFNNWSWSDFGKSVGVGAISGAATFGIGQAFGAVGGTGSFLGDAGKELVRAGAHGLANGMISGFTGGDFMQGFASGALGSLGGSAFQGLGGSFADSFMGTVGFSALSGGVGSALSGGNFWQGAATGAMVGALNMGEKHAENMKAKKTYEAMLRKLMSMREGTVITGREMDKYYPGASKAFNSITKVADGIKFDVKWDAKFAMKTGVIPSRVKDGSIAHITNETININSQIINVLHINSPGNILRKDPFNIYVNDNSYCLPNATNQWFKLAD
jgi:RHS repeat-associated protein